MEDISVVPARAGVILAKGPFNRYLLSSSRVSGGDPSIVIANNKILIDCKSRQEMIYFGYIKWLHSYDLDVYADKLRATNNADEIVAAAMEWVNEGLKHERKNDIQDFARATTLLRIGVNDYVADVVAGKKTAA